MTIPAVRAYSKTIVHSQQASSDSRQKKGHPYTVITLINATYSVLTYYSKTVFDLSAYNIYFFMLKCCFFFFKIRVEKLLDG